MLTLPIGRSKRTAEALVLVSNINRVANFPTKIRREIVLRLAYHSIKCVRNFQYGPIHKAEFFECFLGKAK